MKIEKINENQIRCTLTREDLASRHLKLSELAYGTEKAKNLFRDMMRQANFEFGFEAEDIPLMIEAIPLNSECIVLIITKVEDPEELDTRFARFAPDVSEDSDIDKELDNPEDFLGLPEPSGLAPDDEIFELFRRMQNAAAAPAPENEAGAQPAPSEQPQNDDRIRLFMFPSLQLAMELCTIIADSYNGLSTLYKDVHSQNYLLLLKQNGGSRESFDRACNIASEYGARRRITSGINAFLAEHCETLIAENAIQALGVI